MSLLVFIRPFMYLPTAVIIHLNHVTFPYCLQGEREVTTGITKKEEADWPKIKIYYLKRAHLLQNKLWTTFFRCVLGFHIQQEEDI